MIKKIILAIVVLFIAAQFLQPEKNKAPEEEDHYRHLAIEYNIEPDVQNLLIASCYDCHSNHTRYPWYGNITPFNYLLANHIHEGKMKFNFADFSSYPLDKLDHKFHEMEEEIEKNTMPMEVYVYLHPNAKLSEEEKQKLIDWAQKKRSEIGKHE